jgi:mRNA turnover protein 4
LLRSLGLPVKVNKGTLELPEPYTVCETGQTLTPEQARLLKLFKEPMSVFAMHVTGFWHDGQYTRILKDGSQVVVGEGDVMQDEDDDEVEEAEEDEDMEDGDD